MAPLPMDNDINIYEAVHSAFQMYDNLAEAGPTIPEDPIQAHEGVQDHHDGSSSGSERTGSTERGQPQAQQHEEPPDMHVDDDIPRPLEEDATDFQTAAQSILEDSSTTPLFTDAQLSCLSATLLLLNCLRVHGASNALINELFTLLSQSVLPTVNSLPTREYSASKMLRQLGLGYEMIHCCQDGYMLFWGVGSELLDRCTKCGKARYRRVGKSLVPVKILRYFHLIPRLQRMYSIPFMAGLQTWHRHGRSTDGMIRHVVDSIQWQWIDQNLGDFGEEDRNIRLGLATDGVNPYGIKSSNWSSWLVCLLNHNFPSWFTTKKHFILLSMIIPGKESVTCETFDVYLQPLIEEFLALWEEGVPTYDAAKYGGSSWFTMRAILLWTIHDFPAYGIVAGCVTKGYRSCSICGPGTISRRSTALKKN
jgi:hypothetical protein